MPRRRVSDWVELATQCPHRDPRLPGAAREECGFDSHALVVPGDPAMGGFQLTALLTGERPFLPGWDYSSVAATLPSGIKY